MSVRLKMEAVNRCVWTFPDCIRVAVNLATLSLRMGRIVTVSMSPHTLDAGLQS